MGADLCSTFGDDEQGWRSVPPALRVRGITPRIFFVEILYAKPLHFGEYLCDNWSIKWIHFAVLNTDVEAFLINFY